MQRPLTCLAGESCSGSGEVAGHGNGLRGGELALTAAPQSAEVILALGPQEALRVQDRPGRTRRREDRLVEARPAYVNGCAAAVVLTTAARARDPLL